MNDIQNDNLKAPLYLGRVLQKKKKKKTQLIQQQKVNPLFTICNDKTISCLLMINLMLYLLEL